MTKLKKSDTIKIITLIRANYESAYAITSEEEAEMLVKFWYESLKDFSWEIVYEATKRAIQSSKFAPRLADILEEAEKLANPDKKSEEQLWAELVQTLGSAYDYSRYLAYPQHYEWANKKLNEVYESLDEDLKLYVVNVSTLIELSELTPENLVFEKARFFKQMPTLRKNSEYRAQAKKFLNAVKATPALPEGGKPEES